MRAPFVMTLSLGAVAAASAMACGLDRGAPLTGTDGGTAVPPTYPPTPTGTVAPQPPPASACDEFGNEPVEGTPCYIQQGLTCSYPDQCTGRPPDAPAAKDYVCVENLWKQVSTIYVAVCPTEIPAYGTWCGDCGKEWPAQCSYGDDSGCPPVVATCDPVTETWSVQASSCNPPAPVQDAGVNPGP